MHSYGKKHRDLSLHSKMSMERKKTKYSITVSIRTQNFLHRRHVLRQCALRRLGINLWNLCRVNSTHFFLAGGYEPQDETDKFRPRHDVGPLDEAWIFNDGSRKIVAKMNQARQNFACSLAFFNEVVSFRFESILSNVSKDMLTYFQN